MSERRSRKTSGPRLVVAPTPACSFSSRSRIVSDSHCTSTTARTARHRWSDTHKTTGLFKYHSPISSGSRNVIASRTYVVGWVVCRKILDDVELDGRVVGEAVERKI